jgi:hypothetical protein
MLEFAQVLRTTVPRELLWVPMLGFENVISRRFGGFFETAQLRRQGLWHGF